MSTQILTELPNIQKAGMDFDSVVAEVKNIINDNPNWKANWNDFYDSEAGTLFVQLMAWIADNMSTRQDLLFNEMFLGTAQKDTDKIRHLKQIGYIPQMPHSSRAKIKITLNRMANSKVTVVKENPSNNTVLSGRVAQLASFESKDINGRPCSWEIIKLKNGKPDYLGGIYLDGGNTEYWKDSNGDPLYAIQGRTVYEEFVSSTENGSFFNLKEKDIAANSLCVYLHKGGAVQELKLVNSFVSKEALDESKSSSIPYVLELNEDLTYKIRFASKGLLKDSKLLPANSVVSVFYRVSNGSLGNVKSGSINKETNYKDSDLESYGATIINEYPGVEGSDKESLNDAVMNGPISLRTMDRAVTPEDYNVILERNTSVFKTKTYTASNQPRGFREYYGRFINPQESFSFVMLNKDHNGIPTSKFNSFPWITTIREPRMNEKYIFDNAEYNRDVKIGSTNYNVIVNREGGKSEHFKNLTILDLGKNFNDSLYKKDSSGNFLIDKNGNYEENRQLKAKITTSPTEASFFNEIPFSLLSDNDKTSVIKMNLLQEDDEDYINGTDVNIIMDDNARFITRQSFEKDKPVNVLDCSKLTFIINDEFEVIVNLLIQKDSASTLSAYYLLWDNPFEGSPDGKSSTVEAAAKRRGIKQLINDSINTAISGEAKFSKFASTSYQYLGIENITDPTDSGAIIGLKEGKSNLQMKIGKKVDGVVTYRTYRFGFVAEGSGRPTSVAGAAGSLEYLASYLNFIFEQGRWSVGDQLEKPVEFFDESDAKWKNIEYGELQGLEAVVAPRNIFNTDYVTDIEATNGIVKINYDIRIYNKNTSNSNFLVDYSYIDKYGYNHNLLNVVDLQDPPEVGLNNDGFFKVVLNRTNLVNRNSAEAKNYLLPEPTQAVGEEAYKNMCEIINIPSTSKKELCRLKISSPTKGGSSTIYLKENSKDDGGDFAKNILKVYFIDGYSYKAYGVKRLHLLKKDPLSLHGVVDGKDLPLSVEAHRGNIIFENSCIYTEPDFSNLFVSYSLSSNDRIEIGSSYENYYYQGNEGDETLKKDNPVIGILGQTMNYTIEKNGQKKYDIDTDRSHYNIKFTKEPKLTNSIFAIKDDLGVIGVDKINVVTGDIKLNTEENKAPTLSFSIDDEPIIDVDIKTCNNASDIIRKIKSTVKNLSSGFQKIKENIDTIVSSPFESINQIKFQNIKTNSEMGNIKFYAANATDAENQALYKAIFGTSKTNSEFYALYPKELFNDSVVINTGNGDEYFYCPKLGKGLELTFTFRKLIVGDNGLLSSKPADYYIDVEKSVEGTTKYKFFLKKTKDSKFPDSYFYMHFVNDKTYDFDTNNNIKETDESILQSYMRNYKISGTDIIFLQPYFKTYDIAASITYNINFNKTEISKNVKAAIDNVCDLQHSDIAGGISRAKIFKAIMNCDGVEDCKITYLGYDFENNLQDNYEELTAKFYEVICIHEDDNISNMHGKILTFDESGSDSSAQGINEE